MVLSLDIHFHKGLSVWHTYTERSNLCIVSTLYNIILKWAHTLLNVFTIQHSVSPTMCRGCSCMAMLFVPAIHRIEYKKDFPKAQATWKKFLREILSNGKMIVTHKNQYYNQYCASQCKFMNWKSKNWRSPIRNEKGDFKWLFVHRINWKIAYYYYNFCITTSTDLINWYSVLFW